MKKKLLMVSFDAMVGEDVAYLRAKPESNFNRVMQDCAQVGSMRTIYPSITYPAHFSIASGCTTGKTGFYQNSYLAVGNSGKKGWILDTLDRPVEDFFAAAKRGGRTTASVYWPSMASNPNIDWLINEYFFPNPEEGLLEGFAAQGANRDALRAVASAMGRFPRDFRNRAAPTRENTFDDFIIQCLCTLLKEQKPDFAVAHHCYIDTVRHRYGLFNDHVRQAVDAVDACIGQIADALEEAGVYEETDFVILSDHGQMNFSRIIKPNLLLQRGGFLSANAQGQLESWQAYAQSNGMSATVYLRDPGGRALYDRVYGYLRDLAAEGVWGFTQVLTVQETREQYGLYGDFSFVLESDGYTSYSEALHGPLVGQVDYSDYRLGRATHGYAPQKGPQPIFCARGPSFRQGGYLEQGRVIDIAPTLAAVMGQTMPDAEGRVLTQLLN